MQYSILRVYRAARVLYHSSSCSSPPVKSSMCWSALVLLRLLAVSNVFDSASSRLGEVDQLHDAGATWQILEYGDCKSGLISSKDLQILDDSGRPTDTEGQSDRYGITIL